LRKRISFARIKKVSEKFFAQVGHKMSCMVKKSPSVCDSQKYRIDDKGKSDSFKHSRAIKQIVNYIAKKIFYFKRGGVIEIKRRNP
jgi:hypothetical protein